MTAISSHAAAAARETRTVVYSDSDLMGQDGDWAEGEAWSPRSRAAFIYDEQDNADDTDELERADEIAQWAVTYTEVDLLNLADLQGRDWDDLMFQWMLSRTNGWTSDVADALMLAEVRRRAVD